MRLREPERKLIFVVDYAEIMMQTQMRKEEKKKLKTHRKIKYSKLIFDFLLISIPKLSSPTSSKSDQDDKEQADRKDCSKANNSVENIAIITLSKNPRNGSSTQVILYV
jgi:hypothetical protein